MVGMGPHEAEDMVVQMNARDAKRRERAERKPADGEKIVAAHASEPDAERQRITVIEKNQLDASGTS